MYILDHEFVDAFGFEGVRHGFGDEDGQHDRHGVRERVRQLEHDHRERNGRPRDARQRGRGTDHGVQPWDDARRVRAARCEHGRGGPAPLRVLHCEPDDAAGAGADPEGRDEDPRGELDPECHDCQGGLDDHRDEDHAHHLEGVFAWVEHAEARVGIGRAGETHCEEVVDELSSAHERVAVDEAQDRRDRRNLGIGSVLEVHWDKA